MDQTPAAAFDEAIELVNTGRIDEAEALCRTELASRPGDVNVLGLLGAVLIKTHQFDEAETTLKETIRLAPTFAKPHQDIGHLLLERQRPEEAIEYLDAPIIRIGGPFCPVPFSPILESEFIPSEDRIIEAVKTAMKG